MELLSQKTSRSNDHIQHVRFRYSSLHILFLYFTHVMEPNYDNCKFGIMVRNGEIDRIVCHVLNCCSRINANCTKIIENFPLLPMVIPSVGFWVRYFLEKVSSRLSILWSDQSTFCSEILELPIAELNNLWRHRYWYWFDDKSQVM